MNKYLRQALVARGYFAPEGGGEGGEGGGGGGGAPSTKEDEVPPTNGDDVQPPADDDANKSAPRKFSDDEAAKLLKENMQRKAELKKLAEEREQLKATLAQFEGIDVEEVKRLVTEKQAAEEDKLKKAGEWRTGE